MENFENLYTTHCGVLGAVVSRVVDLSDNRDTPPTQTFSRCTGIWDTLFYVRHVRPPDQLAGWTRLAKNLYQDCKEKSIASSTFPVVSYSQLGGERNPLMREFP